MELDQVPYKLISSILVIAVIVGVVVKVTYFTPKYNRVDEGFFGGVARGSGHPDCLRTLPEGSQLLDLLTKPNMDNKQSGVSEASPDYQELQLILSKLGCLKKDLLSPSGIPEATRYQAFETAHDRINVAEVAGMCLSQNISSRDLDIVFMTWRDRGKVLLRKLCTVGNLTEKDVTIAEKLFNKAWKDSYEIATSQCLKTDFSKQNGGSTGGDVNPFEPEHLKDARSYDYKYGGLSASGWNGAV
jgi:hypothetical protein